MRVRVNELNDEGNIEVAGTLNGTEVSYLVQFAINYLMSIGAEFSLKDNSEDEDGKELMRIKMPEGSSVH